MAAPGDPDGGGRAPADDAQPRGDDEAREEGGEATAEADADADLSPPPPPEEASGVAELNQLIEAQVEALNALADKHRERAVQNGTDTVDASEAVTAWRDEQLAQALDRERERLFALEEQLVDEGVNPAADLPAVARAHAMSAASVGDGDDATLLVNPLRAAARSENGALSQSRRRTAPQEKGKVYYALIATLTLWLVGVIGTYSTSVEAGLVFLLASAPSYFTWYFYHFNHDERRALYPIGTALNFFWGGFVLALLFSVGLSTKKSIGSEAYGNVLMALTSLLLLAVVIVCAFGIVSTIDNVASRGYIQEGATATLSGKHRSTTFKKRQSRVEYFLTRNTIALCPVLYAGLAANASILLGILAGEFSDLADAPLNRLDAEYTALEYTREGGQAIQCSAVSVRSFPGNANGSRWRAYTRIGAALHAFCKAGLCEELWRLVVALLVMARGRISNRQPAGLVLYNVLASLGFSCAEAAILAATQERSDGRLDTLDTNDACILYSLSVNRQFTRDYNLSMDRAALVTPLHGLCGALWGLAVAQLQFFDADKLRRRSPLLVRMQKFVQTLRQSLEGTYLQRKKKLLPVQDMLRDSSTKRALECVRVLCLNGSLAVVFHGIYDFIVMVRVNERNHLPVEDWTMLAQSDPAVYTLTGFTLLFLFFAVRMLSIGVTAVAPWKQISSRTRRIRWDQTKRRERGMSVMPSTSVPTPRGRLGSIFSFNTASEVPIAMLLNPDVPGSPNPAAEGEGGDAEANPLAVQWSNNPTAATPQ